MRGLSLRTSAAISSGYRIKKYNEMKQKALFFQKTTQKLAFIVICLTTEKDLLSQY